MRTLLFPLVLAFAGCSTPSPAAPAADAAPAPAAPAASAPAAPPAATPAVAYPSAGPEWAKVPLAEGAIGSAHASADVPATFRNGAGKVACPVMGMEIKEPSAAVSYADHEGVRYFFCCDSCEKLFLDDPTVYANGKYLADHDLDPTAPAACADEKQAG